MTRDQRLWKSNLWVGVSISTTTCPRQCATNSCPRTQKASSTTNTSRTRFHALGCNEEEVDPVAALAWVDATGVAGLGVLGWPSQVFVWPIPFGGGGAGGGNV